MLNLTWKVFCMTGNIDTYLLLKELEDPEVKNNEQPTEISISLTEYDSTIH